MKVVEPVTILLENITESNLFDTAPILFNIGNTYALNNYVSVVGALGEVLIYRSLQEGNVGNSPESSPTWWVYSSLTYSPFVQGSAYPVGHRVLSSGFVYESLVEFNTNVLDPVANPPWFNIGTNTSTLPLAWNAATTYNIGDRVLLTLTVPPGSVTLGDPSDIVVYQKIWVSNINGNLDLEPDPNPPYLPPGPWTEDKTHPVPWIKTVSYAPTRVVYTPDNKLWQTTNGCGYIEPSLTYVPTWLKIGASNRTAMFDNQSFTTSIANKEIKVTIPTGIIDTIALVNINAEIATVTVRNGLGGDVVYTKTVGLTGGNPTNAWDYYFSDPLLRTNQYVFDGILPFVNSYVTLELTSSSEVSIGNLIVGKSKDLGLSIYGAQAGILDFSGKTTDSFGNTSFVQRGYKKTLSIQTEVRKENINQVQRTLYNLRAKPSLWVSTTDTELSEPLVLFGFYKDFSTDISYPTHALCSLEIEGLI